MRKSTRRSRSSKLATADRMLNEGNDVADVCRELQVSEQTGRRLRTRVLTH